jgi:DNA ligase (NAD+)
VAAFFRDARNRETVARLTESGVTGRVQERDAATGGVLKGLSVVFTGEMTGMTRSEAESLVKELGGSAPSSVSRKTSFLVTGTDPGSKLAKARSLGVKVIDESSFLEMIEKARKGKRPEGVGSDGDR